MAYARRSVPSIVRPLRLGLVCFDGSVLLAVSVGVTLAIVTVGVRPRLSPVGLPLPMSEKVVSTEFSLMSSLQQPGNDRQVARLALRTVSLSGHT